MGKWTDRANDLSQYLWGAPAEAEVPAAAPVPYVHPNALAIRANREKMLQKAKSDKLRDALGLARAKLGASVGSYQNPAGARLAADDLADAAIGNQVMGQQAVDPAVWGAGGRRYPTALPTSATPRATVGERLAALTGAGGKYQEGRLPGSTTEVVVRPGGRVALYGATRPPSEVLGEGAPAVAEMPGVAAKVAITPRQRLIQAREARIRENMGRMMGSNNPNVRRRADILAERLGLPSDTGPNPAGDLIAFGKKLINLQQTGQLSAAGAKAMMDAEQDRQRRLSEAAVAAEDRKSRESMSNAANEIKRQEIADARARADELAAIERARLEQQGEQSRNTLTQSQKQFEEEMALKRQAAAGEEEQRRFNRSPEGQRIGLAGRGADLPTIDAVAPLPAAAGGLQLPKAMAPEQRAAAIEQFQNFGLSNPGASREQLMAMLSRLGLTTEDLRTYRSTLNPSWTEGAFEDPGVLNFVTRWWNSSNAPKYDQRRRSRKMLDSLLGN